jgi:hypothetical protein
MKRRLALVGPAEELLGVAPPALERAARGCATGDATHRGLMFLCATLARRAVSGSVPPKARGELLAGLDVAEAWARGQQSPGAVRNLRSQCFGAAPAIEKQTIEVVESAAAHLGPQRKTGLDAHAGRVVRRYVGLAAHYACSAVVLTLDAVEQPARAASVPQQVCGARAYQATGLGAARFGEFRAQAWEQAEWEASREGAPTDHGVEGLALQLFHEFLGVRWKTHADLETLAVNQFIDWALAGRS